jgi:hypothetical protein
MADYAGEPIRIATKDALNFDGKPLTPIDVDTVTCEVWNTDFTVKVQDVQHDLRAVVMGVQTDTARA